MSKAVVHFAQGMNDEVNGRAQGLRGRQLGVQPLLQLEPVLDPVGEALVVDDDEQAEIRLELRCQFAKYT